MGRGHASSLGTLSIFFFFSFLLDSSFLFPSAQCRSCFPEHVLYTQKARCWVHSCGLFCELSLRGRHQTHLFKSKESDREGLSGLLKITYHQAIEPELTARSVRPKDQGSFHDPSGLCGPSGAVLSGVLGATVAR